MEMEDEGSLDAGSGDERQQDRERGRRAPRAGDEEMDEEEDIEDSQGEGEEGDQDDAALELPPTDFELLADVTNGLGRLMVDEAGRKVFVKGDDCIGTQLAEKRALRAHICVPGNGRMRLRH